MSVYLSYHCLLCPTTYDNETETWKATTFGMFEEACAHLVDDHRIAPVLLQHVKAGAPISIRISSLTQTAHPWKLPKYSEVVEVVHDDTSETASDDESASPASAHGGRTNCWRAAQPGILAGGNSCCRRHADRACRS
jgi:hypothetical protein